VCNEGLFVVCDGELAPSGDPTSVGTTTVTSVTVACCPPGSVYVLVS